jgi:hypothetical protein
VFSAKQQGILTISDFDLKEDHLAHVIFGNGKEAWDNFLNHSEQQGDDAVYTYGNITVVLEDVNFKELTPENFTDSFPTI